VIAGDAPAQQPPLALSADTRERGYVDLRLRSAPGVQVTISEGPEQLVQVTPTESSTSLRRVTTWRCDRRARTFTATSADCQRTSAEVRTPS
jgi:hypothetical protein